MFTAIFASLSYADGIGQCPGANKEETEDVAVTPDSRGAEMGY